MLCNQSYSNRQRGVAPNASLLPCVSTPQQRVMARHIQIMSNSDATTNPYGQAPSTYGTLSMHLQHFAAMTIVKLNHICNFKTYASSSLFPPGPIYSSEKSPLRNLESESSKISLFLHESFVELVDNGDRKKDTGSSSDGTHEVSNNCKGTNAHTTESGGSGDVLIQNMYKSRVTVSLHDHL